MLALELTEKEAEVLVDYIFRKLCKLSDAGLRDSKCYIQLFSVYTKLNKLIK